MTAGYQENQSVELKGSIKISGDVVKMIAGMTLNSVLGVVGIRGAASAPSDPKSLTRGIKIELSGNLVKVDLEVWIEYGFNIPNVALQIQNAIKKAVEEMAGLAVSAVNVTVEGVSLVKET